MPYLPRHVPRTRWCPLISSRDQCDSTIEGDKGPQSARAHSSHGQQRREHVLSDKSLLMLNAEGHLTRLYFPPKTRLVTTAWMAVSHLRRPASRDQLSAPTGSSVPYTYQSDFRVWLGAEDQTPCKCGALGCLHQTSCGKHWRPSLAPSSFPR